MLTKMRRVLKWNEKRKRMTLDCVVNQYKIIIKQIISKFDVTLEKNDFSNFAIFCTRWSMSLIRTSANCFEPSSNTKQHCQTNAQIPFTGVSHSYSCALSKSRAEKKLCNLRWKTGNLTTSDTQFSTCDFRTRVEVNVSARGEKSKTTRYLRYCSTAQKTNTR